MTDCVLNVFRNFVPNKVIKDVLWMTPEKIKRMILEKAKIYKMIYFKGLNFWGFNFTDFADLGKIAKLSPGEKYATGFPRN